MPEKNPENWSVIVWLLIIGMSILGGVSSWYRRVKNGHPRAMNAAEFVGEMAMSGMMGFVGFALADWYFDSISVAAAFAGISAHFSTRLLFSAESLLNVYADRIQKKIGAPK
jgi:CHASE2 domain-containing sensor protein